MRPSDAKLYEALHSVGLYELAARAKAGEFNEFFGGRLTPMRDLVDELMDTQDQAQVAQLIARVREGEFAATAKEMLEWRNSSESQELQRELQDE